MKRREFITLLGGAASAWPLAARAQQGDRVRRIGVLIGRLHADRSGRSSSHRGVSRYVPEAGLDRWPQCPDRVSLGRWRCRTHKGLGGRIGPFSAGCDRGLGQPALAELHRLTSTIPIVFTQVADPVDSGFVAGLARPGGNITGFQAFEPAMGGKWLGVLKEAAPNLSRVAVLFGSDSASNVAYLRAAEAVAPSLGVTVTAVDVHDGGEIERTVATFASQPDGGLIVVPHSNTIANRGSIIILAARHRLPAIYPYRYFATEGGLMSYGPDQIDQWRGRQPTSIASCAARSRASFRFRRRPSSSWWSTSRPRRRSG